MDFHSLPSRLRFESMTPAHLIINRDQRQPSPLDQREPESPIQTIQTSTRPDRPLPDQQTPTSRLVRQSSRSGKELHLIDRSYARVNCPHRSLHSSARPNAHSLQDTFLSHRQPLETPLLLPLRRDSCPARAVLDGSYLAIYSTTRLRKLTSLSRCAAVCRHCFSPHSPRILRHLRLIHLAALPSAI
jgi:hypothetical protein